MWQDIPAYLSGAIESIQRRALRIVFPELSYQQALNQANFPTLANRREFLCKKLMADMMSESHPISFLLPQTKTRSIPYKLRTIGNEKTITKARRTKRTQDFLHLKPFCNCFSNYFYLVVL